MISLRYRPVTVPLPSRYRFWVSLNTVTSPLPYRYGPLLTVTGVTDRYSPLLTVTHRYSPLLTVTVTHRFFGNLIFFSLQLKLNFFRNFIKILLQGVFFFLDNLKLK